MNTTEKLKHGVMTKQRCGNTEVEDIVNRAGNSGRVYLPKAWVDKKLRTILLASLILVIISCIIIPHDVLAKNKGKKFLRETKHFLGDTKQFFRDLTDKSQTANASLVDKLDKKGEDLNRPVCEAAQKGDNDQVEFEFDKLGVMLGIHLSETMRHGILSTCPK